MVLNGLPAFILLMGVPTLTEWLFVWTVRPPLSARLLGVMYGNALLLVIFAYFQPNWARARIVMVLIAFFAVAATILTFVFLTPFLQHPWFHLAFWLTMYLILFVAAPVMVFRFERKEGGRLPVTYPLSIYSRGLGIVSAIGCALMGLGLIFALPTVNTAFPWVLTPLVGAIVGVWFCSLGLTYGWAVWDGDWLRVRPIFYQAVPTAALIFLLPFLHQADLRADLSFQLNLYNGIALAVVILNALSILMQTRALGRSVTDATR